MIMRHIQLSRKIFVLAFVMLFALTSFGQDKKQTFAPYWYVKANILTGAAQGDLPDNPLSNLGFGGGLAFGRQFSPVLGLFGKAQYFTLKGEDESIPQTFKNWSVDLTLNATVNASNLLFGYKDRTVSFVPHIGIGQVQWQAKLFNAAGLPIAYYGHDDIAGSITGDGIGGRKVAFIIPMGLGIDVRLSDAFDLNFDFTTQWADTDDLDARGTGDNNDWYSYASAGITYNIGQGNGLNKMVKEFDQVEFEATPKVLEEKGDMIDYEITGTFPEKYFGKKVAVLMQPILKYEGGQTELKTFTLKGEEVMGEGDVIPVDGGKFTIKDSFKYTPEMNRSELVIIPLGYVAKQGTLGTKEEILASVKNAELGNRKIADGVIYTSERIGKDLANEVAEHGYEKETIVTKQANIYFAKNLYNLNWRVELNKDEMSKKAMQAMEEFAACGWEIKSIDIDGWASPEGEETFNENLSENRSKTGNKYIDKLLKKLNLQDVAVNVNFHGQDWNGFTQAVNKSDIADKNAIFNVINRAGSTLQKEQEIRNMILIYPEIEKDILPPLRRAEIAVNAFQPKKSDAEILSLAKAGSAELDIFEYLYAADMADCKDKLAIYKTIMSKYPKCWKSKNNAAIILMKEGKLDKAEELLKDANKMYPKVPAMINNLGVLAVLKDDYSAAEKYFQKAQDLGVNVNYNMGVVEIEKGDYEKALRLFGNTTCDYNVALAQILTGKYAAAQNNLKCIKGGCEAANAYLMAVVGARTANASMVYENLIKAIKVNDKLKAVAKDDVEFINYFETPDFKAIVE